MENKINIADLLRDCPTGMELDCTMYDGVKLKYVSLYKDDDYPICIETKNGFSTKLTKYGQNVCLDDAKCVIFPKGKTTWEGFIPPCKFKDGDIIFTCALFSGICSDYLITGMYYTWISIFHKMRKDQVITYVDIENSGRYFPFWMRKGELCRKNDITYQRLATEEEKERLFKYIKDNGYKWNAETKTLEKLGDPIEDKGNISDGYHTFNELYEYRLLYNASMFNELAKQGLYDVHKSKRHSDGTIPFGDENWFIVQAELPTGQISNHYEMKDWGLFNIPEKEKANPYDGHTPKDVAKRLRDFLSLEKLIEPKFKVGDKIRHKDTGIYCTLGEYSEGISAYHTSIGLLLTYKDLEHWELVRHW